MIWFFKKNRLGVEMQALLSVENLCHKATIYAPILDEARRKFQYNRPWIFSDQKKLGKLPDPHRLRIHYIEMWVPHDGKGYTAQNWLKKLEKIDEEIIKVSLSHISPLNLTTCIRQAIDNLPYEDRLELVALEVVIWGKLEKVFQRFFKSSITINLSLFRQLS